MTEAFPHFHIVLLADDSGENLWPIARKQSPACFAPVKPGANESLLTATVARVRPYSAHPLHIITNNALSELLYAELRAHAELSPEQFELICPPGDRGSAFSIALICASIRRDDPDAIVVVLPVDLRVDTDERWPHLLYAAYQIALQDKIVLVGSRQRRKCRDLSYIRTGKRLNDIEDAYEVRTFATDARLASASRAYHEGAYWYSGIFVGRAAGILGLLAHAEAKRRQSAADVESLRRIAETASFFAMLKREAWNTPDAEEIAKTLKCASFEKAALEHASKLIMVSTTIEFSTTDSLEDVGSDSKADAYGNRIIGDALATESQNVTVLAQTPGRFIATYGLDDICIIDTPDALLVSKRAQLKNMDRLLANMRGHDVSQLETSARRPFAWGTATLLVQDEKTATWKIELPAGSNLDALSIPYEYGTFSDKMLKKLREQYVVAQGDVTIQERSDASQPTLMGTGDGFEASAASPLIIMCVENHPATLILTATV